MKISLTCSYENLSNLQLCFTPKQLVAMIIFQSTCNYDFPPIRVNKIWKIFDLVGIRTQDHLEKNTSSCLNQLSYWIRQEMRQFLRALSSVRQARPSTKRDHPPSGTVCQARPSTKRERPLSVCVPKRMRLPRVRDRECVFVCVRELQLSTVKSHIALYG